MQLKDCPPIKTVNCSAWLIEFGSERRLEIWNTLTTIEKVIEYTKSWNKDKKFRISRIDTGSFKLSEILEDYSLDPRTVDQDFDVQF